MLAWALFVGMIRLAVILTPQMLTPHQLIWLSNIVPAVLAFVLLYYMVIRLPFGVYETRLLRNHEKWLQSESERFKAKHEPESDRTTDVPTRTEEVGIIGNSPFGPDSMITDILNPPLAHFHELKPYKSLSNEALAGRIEAVRWELGPKLLILDEPTNGLDPSARQRMIRLIRDIRDSKELQIVLCSHLLRDVEDTCEEVLILNRGKIAHYSNLEEERKANKRFLELETYGANGDFTAAIEKLGCECATSANRMKMILAEGVEIRDIYRIAAENDVRIRRLNFRRDSLEDIFLKAMES